MNNETCKSTIDYEAAFNKAVDDLEKCKQENNYFRSELEFVTSENRRLKAQLDMVYLIFGGKRNE